MKQPSHRVTLAVDHDAIFCDECGDKIGYIPATNEDIFCVCVPCAMKMRTE